MSGNRELFEALDRYGTDASRWPPQLAADMEQAKAGDDSLARAWRDMAAVEAMVASALRQVPPAPAAYGSRMASAVLAKLRDERRRRMTGLTLALGGSWAAAAMVAGLVVSHLMTSVDSDVLAYAEMALGTASLITGN